MDEPTSSDGGSRRPQDLIPGGRLILLVAGLVVAGLAYRWWSAPTLADVESMVNGLNARLPVMTDATTRLEKVTLGDDDIVYRYTLTNALSGGLEGGDLAAALEPQVRPAICAAPMLQTLLRHGRVVRYQYHANDRKLITEIVVKPGECGYIVDGCALRPGGAARSGPSDT